MSNTENILTKVLMLEAEIEELRENQEVMIEALREIRDFITYYCSFKGGI